MVNLNLKVVQDVLTLIKLNMGSDSRLILQLPPHIYKDLNLIELKEIKRNLSDYRIEVDYTFIDDTIGCKLIINKIEYVDVYVVARESDVEDNYFTRQTKLAKAATDSWPQWQREAAGLVGVKDPNPKTYTTNKTDREKFISQLKNAEERAKSWPQWRINEALEK